MKIEIDKDRCLGDGMCVDLCPEEVLEMKDGYPAMADRDRCTECRACEVSCEYEALKCIDE